MKYTSGKKGRPVVGTPRSSSEADSVSHFGSFLLNWGLPVGGLLASAYIFPAWMVVVWPVSLGWMGVSCLVNAARCRRLHCFLTGPFFLVLAVLSLLHGLDVLYLGNNGWEVLGILTMVGGAFLWYVPELLFGKYFGVER